MSVRLGFLSGSETRGGAGILCIHLITTPVPICFEFCSILFTHVCMYVNRLANAAFFRRSGFIPMSRQALGPSHGPVAPCRGLGWAFVSGIRIHAIIVRRAKVPS